MALEDDDSVSVTLDSGVVTVDKEQIDKLGKADRAALVEKLKSARSGLDRLMKQLA